MNKVILAGRLTGDPSVSITGETTIAKWSLAVDRRFSKNDEDKADFIRCTAFGKTAESIEKMVKKGTKIAIVGRIQTGSYTNKENVKVYTTEVVVEEWEFSEKKAENQNTSSPNGYQSQQQVNNQGTQNNQSTQRQSGPAGTPAYSQPGYQNNGGYPQGNVNQNNMNRYQQGSNNGYQNNGGYPQGNNQNNNQFQNVNNGRTIPSDNGGGFMNIPDGISEDFGFGSEENFN